MASVCSPRMPRRAFMRGIACGFLAAPLAVEAQPAWKVWRIGVISYAPPTADMIGPDPKNDAVKALLRGLRELGYVYGQHYVTEPRSAERALDRFPSLAAELVRSQVDLIVAVSASLPAVKQATSTIPVVFPGASDPVGQGFALSLRRPGGNFTGLSFQTADLVVKRLDLVKEVAPSAAPVAVLWDQTLSYQWDAVEAAAQARRWTLVSLPIREVGDLEGAMKSATTARAGALLVTAGLSLDAHPQRVVDLVAKQRLPAMYHQRFYVQAGGLISYAPSLLEIWRAAAVFVDKILKGAKPGDLPVEQPTKVDLAINLKTAKALGLTIPPSLLQRADHVIE
ncbi:MAG: ABC transporter substrate-binding protein [Candidatus Rokuibacteriota bacterium]